MRNEDSEPTRENPAERRAFARLDRYFEAAIRVLDLPGAAVGFGRVGRPPVGRCYGHLTYEKRERVTPSTLYDVACITKPVTAGSLLMRLVHEEGLDLDAPVALQLPEFATHGKERITWVHLLVHGGGLEPAPSYDRLRNRSAEEVRESILAYRPRFEPGTRYEYCCDGYVVMMMAMERWAGLPFDRLVSERIFHPLGMDTARFFRPVDEVPAGVAPTEFEATPRGRVLHGEVHDHLAWTLGGVSANTGLFMSLGDVERFARAMLGDLPGKEAALFPPEICARFARPVDPARFETRGLGWDTRSPQGYTVAGRALGARSYGHTGNTGCSLWIDPEQGIWVALLSNAIHRERGRKRYLRMRPRLSEMASAVLAAQTQGEDTGSPVPGGADRGLSQD